MMTAKEAKIYSEKNLIKYEENKYANYIHQLENDINTRIYLGFFESNIYSSFPFNDNFILKIKDYMTSLGYKYNSNEDRAFWFSWD